MDNIIIQKSKIMIFQQMKESGKSIVKDEKVLSIRISIIL
jgi:hypothetical protein